MTNPFAAAVQRALPTSNDGPTDYELAVLRGLQSKPVYPGYLEDRTVFTPKGPIVVPDPRIAQTARRRAKNRVARRSRRINRLRSHP